MFVEFPKSFSFINSNGGALAIFVGFLLLAIFVHIFFHRLLRFLTRKTKSELDDEIRRKLRKPLFLSIVFVGAIVSFLQTALLLEYRDYIVKGAVTLLVFLWMQVLFSIINIFIKHYEEIPKKIKMGGLSKQMLPFVEKVLKAIVIVIALFILLMVWKLDISPLLASAGILSLAIAFAAQDTIANVFGGVSIFLDKTYEIGHFIIVGDKYRGEVIDVGLRTTKIKTRDDIIVTIPNSEMAKTHVVNESGGYKGMLRVRMPIGIMYGENVRKVEKILKDVAKKAEWVAREPESKLRFRKLGENALEFEFLFWVKKPLWRGRALSEMNTLVYERFNKEKIGFGYVAEYKVDLIKGKKKRK